MIDPPYYQRFGFQLAADHGIAMPDENPQRVWILAQPADALRGVCGVIEAVKCAL